MYFRTSDKMKISDKLAIRREVGGGGGQLPPHLTEISATGLEINMKLKALMLRTHTSLMEGLIIWVGFRMLVLVDPKSTNPKSD